MAAKRDQNLLLDSILVTFFCLVGIGISVSYGLAAEVERSDNSIDVFRATLLEDNGDIFWAPASGFTADDSWSNIFGDEARSVFGSIPEIHCSPESGSSFHLEVGGRIVRQHRNANGDYQFEHRSLSGERVLVTSSIEKCDKPSLANTAGHSCGASSRVVLLKSELSPEVDWVVLCRKNATLERLVSESDYWHAENPDFSLLGIIGFNPNSGEVVFFDGTNYAGGRSDQSMFSWAQPYPPPGGGGYNDFEGRKRAYKLYSYSERIACEGCHDNKEPWIVTPHLKYRGFGYNDLVRESKFGVDNILPLVQPRSDEAPYRVIGTRYTRDAELSNKTFRDPTGSCTYCHTLTTGWTGKVLAYDAVGKINPNDPYKAVFDKVNASRTTWAKRKKNTQPWMVPWLGPNVKLNPETGLYPSEIDQKNWSRIAHCINETSTEDCQYRRAYTSCPIPESTKTECAPNEDRNNTCSRLADPYGPSEMEIATSPIDGNPQEKFPFDRKVSVNWTYLNGLGSVPQRDDVRFNLAIKEVEISDQDVEPRMELYPTLEETFDPYFADAKKQGKIHYCNFGFVRDELCHILRLERGEYFINNLSYQGHVRNTMPDPTHSPRNYKVVIPARCNKRYLVRLVPKRFCFDQSGVLASSVDHVAYFDVKCEDGEIIGQTTNP